MSRQKIAVWFVVLVLGIGSILFLAEGTTVRRICIFRCQNTGSLKGYTALLGIVQVAHWQNASSLELFIRAKFPNEFTNRWEQFAGHGKNYRGRTVLFGHFRPALKVAVSTMDAYVATLSDAEKKELYDFLRPADPGAAIAKSTEINEVVWNKLGDEK